MELDSIQKLIKPNDSKIVLLVMDGLGGLPMEPGGPTELEIAETPNLDKLAFNGICGLQQLVPVILWSKVCRSDSIEQFSERTCMIGGLGPRIPSKDLMPISLANARHLEKFGA